MQPGPEEGRAHGESLVRACLSTVHAHLPTGRGEGESAASWAHSTLCTPCTVTQASELSQESRRRGQGSENQPLC